MLCIEKTNVTTTMTGVIYDRQDSGYPESLGSLETHHIRGNYKRLKEEMEPNEILDYLVQYDILSTDENTNLLKECRAKKCDYILRKLMTLTHLEKFTKMMSAELEAQELQCFRRVLCLTSSASRDSNNGSDANLKPLSKIKYRGQHREKLLREISRRINVGSANISDDFLQEDLISVEQHEAVSLIKNTREAAQELLVYSEKNRLESFSRKLLTILKSYGLNDLADLLQSDEGTEDDSADNELPLTVDMTDGRMYLSAEIPNGKARKVEVKITCSDGSEVVYKALMKEISEAEEEISQKTHSTIKQMSEGSITIWLHTESSDAKEKMRHFIESGDISIFLENLFKTKGVRKLLTKDRYNIQIQIKEVDDATEGSESTTFQPMRKSDLKFKTCLDRCERFLLEELEPGSLIRDKEVGHIFSPIRADIEHWTNRTDRVKLLLEHLREKSEETIKLVMDRLKDKNRYVYDKLYPDVEKFQDVDIRQVKRNILDNLPELLGSMSVSSLQTPFLSAGIMSQDELDSLHENSESVRAENLKFVQMVLHRGDEAIRIVLLALEDSCGSDLSERLQNKTTIIYEREDERRNAKIEYEAFNEENGLLFQGNFLLELKSERTTGNVTRERLCAGNEEQQPSIENPSSEHPGSQSEESTSSDSDSNGTTPKDVPKNESRIKALEADTSTILSKLTRKLGKVEYVVDIRRILSTRDVGKRARMERVKRKYSRKFGAIEEEVLKLNTVLNELQILSRIFRDKVGFLTNWDDNEDNDDDDDEDNDNDDNDDDDDDDDSDDDRHDDDESQRIEDWSETVSSPETHLPFERQMSALVVRSTDEDSTMDSDEEEQEDINVLSRKSSKYQSILVGKFHQLETVKSVLDAFRHISDKETQLMAVKNILNEEQYKRLEKYIIKLRVISNKIKEVKGFAEVA